MPPEIGCVERTSSEWTASALDTMLVNDFPSLPPDLLLPGGSLDVAYQTISGADCDGNGIPDDCDIAADPGLDQNENGGMGLVNVNPNAQRSTIERP